MGLGEFLWDVNVVNVIVIITMKKLKKLIIGY